MTARMLTLSILTLALSTSVVGCKKEEPKEEKKTEVAKPKEPELPPVKLSELAPDEPKTELGAVPVPEDLEEEAARTIRLDNLEAELDRLEAEISGF